jgi:hypothetical protein
MRMNYALLVRALPPDRLEEFVDDWLEQRVKDYHSHELWRGTGDLGRDVTGYVTDKRMEGVWDNFQCKQLSSSLKEVAAFVELGKIFMHASNGEFALPRSYFFVAPYGVARAVQTYIAHPERFRQALLDQWNTRISKKLVSRKEIPLTPLIEDAIKTFDFRQVHWIDATKLVADPACKAALVKWFGSDPGASPRGVVPSQVQGDESEYISQLLAMYEQRGPGKFKDASVALASLEFGSHLRDQRTRFFDAVAFERFYRDSTPKEYISNFKDDIYHGVVEIHRDTHRDGLERMSQVLKQAAIIQPSGVLGKHAGPQVKQGTCHQFANEGPKKGRLLWHP